MTVVRVERLVQRPPAQVFDFVATRHFDNHPRWDPDLLEMRQVTPGPVGPGTTAHVVRRQGRRRVEGIATVTEYQPCRRAAWEVQFGTFLLRQAVDVVPQRAGSATRLQLCIEARARAPVSFLLPLVRPRFRRNMLRSLATIDELVGRDNPWPGSGESLR